MVYRGKPSLGCGTCRNRHVKCDQTRPICLVCQRAGRECLGYRDWGELYVRDQTQEVTNTRKVPRRRDSRSSDVFKTQDRLSPAVQQPSFGLGPSIEQLALGYFHSSFVRPIEMHAPDRGYFQVMPTIYLTGPLGSALEAATLSLAFATFRVAPDPDWCAREARANYQLALNRLREALISPAEAATNETLLTVLLMQAIEGYIMTDNATSQGQAHTEGAVALINMRGPEGFQDLTSKKLLASARGSAVMRGIKCFLSADVPFSSFPIRADLGIPFVDNDESIDILGGTNIPMLPMRRVPPLCDKAMNLLALPRSEEISAAIQELVAECHEVDASLVVWSQNVPQPFVDHMAPAGGRISSDSGESSESPLVTRIDSYENIFVARSWNEYRLARLFVHNIIMRCDQWLAEGVVTGTEHRGMERHDQVSFATSEWISQDMINGIRASVPFLRRPPGNPENGLGNNLLIIPLLLAQAAPVVRFEEREWMLVQLVDLADSTGITNSRIGNILRQKLDQLHGESGLQISSPSFASV